MADNHIGLEREFVVMKLELLIILVDEIVLKSSLVVNTGHGETSGHSKNHSLLKWVIVGLRLHIPFLVDTWVLQQEGKCLVLAFPSFLLQIQLEISNFQELFVCQIVVSSLEVHAVKVIKEGFYQLIRLLF